MTEEENGAAGDDERRPMRADAVRNVETLLEAAKTVFANAGVDAPVRDIAARAGVGIGTLYRHFPKRSDLIAAVFRREVELCVERTEAGLRELSPFVALEHWAEAYVDFLSTKQGLSTALYSGDSAYADLPGLFRKRLEPVLDSIIKRATEAGEMRGGVTADELLRAVTGLAANAAQQDPEVVLRLVGYLLDGLRPQRPGNS